MLFRAFNASYSKVSRLASEEVVSSLIRAKCLPILLHADEACPLLSRNRHSFEFTVLNSFIHETVSHCLACSCKVNAVNWLSAFFLYNHKLTFVLLFFTKVDCI